MLNKEHKELERNQIPDYIKILIDKIAAHLLERTQHYGTLHDKNDLTTLGTTNFWLIRDKENGVITLGFSENPRKWDVDQISLDIMLSEHKMLEEKGVAFQPQLF